MNTEKTKGPKTKLSLEFINKIEDHHSPVIKWFVTIFLIF